VSFPRRPLYRAPRRRLPCATAHYGVGDPDREEVRTPVAGGVGGELKVATLVRHTSDDQSEGRPGVKPVVQYRPPSSYELASFADALSYPHRRFQLLSEA